MTKSTAKPTYSQNNTLSIPTRKDFHQRFSGYIYNSDFNTKYKTYPSNIASRIVSDRKFDEQCKRNKLARNTECQ